MSVDYIYRTYKRCVENELGKQAEELETKAQLQREFDIAQVERERRLRNLKEEEAELVSDFEIYNCTAYSHI